MATTEQSAGAGGKFRKKPSRRSQSTPYDRPSSAFRPTQQQQQQLVGGDGASNGWLSKLVDPASRLITAGAHKIFSSVFRKRLLPPPPPPQPQHPSPGEAMEIGDVQPEITTMVAPSGAKEPVVHGDDDSRVSENGGVAELEGILKQKTFTRSEIDHLTALLLSRTAENSVGAQMGSLESKFLDEKVVCSRHERTSALPALKNEAGRERTAAMSTPNVRSKVLEDAVASPAELAKAYMGGRPMRESPPAVGMQYELLREDLSAHYNQFLKPKTPIASDSQKPANDVCAPANGFMTPRFRGRSAIYSMARTPYSRPQPTEVFKLQAAETVSDIHGASSSAHNAIETQQFGGSKKQVLKRRSSVLESDIGFVGPIRRIRQKPNLLHQKTLSLPASGGSYVKHGNGALTNVTEAPSSSIDWSSNHRSTSKAVADSGIPITSSGCVPSQSIEMAQKIFQQLDKFTPKGKSAEKKADIAGETSGKISDMRDGLANKRMNTVDSLKALKTVEDSMKENGFLDSASVHDHTSKISPGGEKGCSRKSVKFSIDDGGAKDSSPSNALDHVDLRPNFDYRQKKRAFQMSAHEDYLELDDDVQTNGVASTPMIKVVESNELAKISAAVSDNTPENATNSAGMSPATKSEPATFLFDANKEESPDGFFAAQKISGFGSPALSSSSATRTSTTQSTEKVNEVVEQGEIANVTTAFGSNSAKMAPISFPPSSIVESAAPKNGKPELPNSLTDVAAKADGPDKIDKKSTLLFGDVSKNVGDASNQGSSAKGFFSVGLPSNGATISNGFPSTASVTTAVSSPIQISSSLNDLSPVPVSVSSPSVFTFSNENGNAVSASTSTVAASAGSLITTATTGSSSSQLSTSVTTPGSSTSTFQFGSPAVPSTSATAATSASESPAISGAKSNLFTFGKGTSSLFNGKPSETASVGNDISGFNASTFTPTSSETQTAAPSANGSLFSFQASSAAVPGKTSIPSFTSQSTSSASSHAFGLNTPTSFNASTSIFGSSTTFANTFTSGSISASSALGSSSVTLPVSSSSNATSSIFGWQSSKPTVPGSIFGTSFQPSGFSVGSTASGTSVAGNSTPNVFGATSSSSAASNSAPFVFGSASVSSSAPLSTPFPSQSTFGSSAQAFPFGSTSPASNNDRMNMEDSMAEDSVQISAPATPVFSVPNSAPSSSFAFGATAPSAGSPFQFGGQPNQIAPQNIPFQPSGSVEFNAGGAGSFSLGSTGGDKSNRRFVKVKKGIRRK